MDLTNEAIVITGGSGFLGQHLVSLLVNNGSTNIIQSGQKLTNWKGVFVPRSSQFDLTTEADVRKFYDLINPTIIIHLAAKVGGIGANRKYPGTFYYQNAIMGTLLMEYARRHNVKKFVTISTVCAYPKYATVPFSEDDLWNGYPEETNAPYGLAKKNLLIQAQAYRQEFNFNSIYLLPVNLYGPGDNFSPESSHVIPALIKKCLDAKASHADEIVCWGTGKATREFLYVKDAANAIKLATEHYDDAEPVNIGSGKEIAISDLVVMIADVVGFTGRIVWDDTKPDGQPRRCLNCERAKAFGFTANTNFYDGLVETVNWYLKQIGQQ